MIDLDQVYDPPSKETRDPCGLPIDDHDIYVIFRSLCGAHGYFCSAGFRDAVAFGGGATPREALQSLAASLRKLADKVEKAARR